MKLKRLSGALLALLLAGSALGGGWAEAPIEAPAVQEGVGQSPVDKPVVQSPTGEQPTQAPAVQEPAAEQPTQVPDPQEPIAEQPTQTPDTQEPVVEQPTQAPDNPETMGPQSTETPGIPGTAESQPTEIPETPVPATERPTKTPATQDPQAPQPSVTPTVQETVTEWSTMSPPTPTPIAQLPTEAPATQEPVIVVPTEVPATQEPVIVVPTEEVPATQEPVIVVPTEAPATQEPVIVRPTEVPATQEPEIEWPTAAPTSQAPATAQPTATPAAPEATAQPAETPAPALSLRMLPQDTELGEDGTAAGYMLLENSGNVSLTLRQASVQPLAAGQTEYMEDWQRYLDTALAPGESVIVYHRSKILPLDLTKGAVERQLLLTAAYKNAEGQEASYEMAPFTLTLALPAAAQVSVSSPLLPSLQFYAALRQPAAAIPLTPAGQTEPVEYLCALVNNGETAVQVTGVQRTAQENALNLPIGPLTVNPGQTAVFSVQYPISAEEISVSAKNAEDAGEAQVSLALLARMDEHSDSAVASNTVVFQHRLLPPQVGLHSWRPTGESQPEDIALQCDVISQPQDEKGYQAGERVQFQIAVTNKTDKDLQGLSLSMALSADEKDRALGDLIVLKSGRTRFITGDYRITKKDLELGMLCGLARAAWEDPATGETVYACAEPVVLSLWDGSDSPTPRTAQQPLSIQQTVVNKPQSEGGFQLGETIRFSVTVQNDSERTQNNVLIYPNPEEASFPGAPLAPARERLYSGSRYIEHFTHTVTAQDLLSGQFNSQVWVSSSDTAGVFSISSQTLSVPVAAYTGQSAQEKQYLNDLFAITGVRPSLAVTCQETSQPENGQYYVAGETLSYEIQITNLSGQPVQALRLFDTLADPAGVPLAEKDALAPGEAWVCFVDYPVSPRDMMAGYVVQEAAVSFNAGDGLLGLTASSPMAAAKTGDAEGASLGETVPGWMECPLPAAAVNGASEESCVGTLLAKGDDTAEYVQHLCAAHQETARQADALTKENTASAWTQAKALWREALMGQIQEYLSVSHGTARGAVLRAALELEAYLNSREALLNTLYPDQPELAQRSLCEQIKEQCLALCYTYHHGNYPRLDSAKTGRYALMSSTMSLPQCGILSMKTQNEDIRFRESLCEDHGAVEAQAMALIIAAEESEETLNAWLSAQRLWQMSLDSQYAEQLTQASPALRQQLELNEMLLLRFLNAYQEMLSYRYPDQPEVAAEQVAWFLKKQVQQNCAAW